MARQACSQVAFVREKPGPGDPLLDFEPVVPRTLRKNSITPELQREFIAHLAATGIVRDAARHIGRSNEALYRLRQKPGAEGFRAAWERALDWAMTRLEDSAFARALRGEERPIIHRGEIVGYERRWNDALVMFFLRARLADRYAPAAHITPGHPVYERIRREVEEEARARANDPANVARVREAIDAKVRAWRKELEAGEDSAD
ncbi:MAG: hypothetical protein G9473_02865 [Erythrobacter sp.]|nr:MAG: hypothetical protein G9473_02865 [Erythrobacter sp.]